MKKSTKRGMACILTLGMALALWGCGDGGSGSGGDAPDTGNGEKIEVKISMTETEDSLDYQRCLEFTENVNAACGDVFDFQIYAGGSLGEFTDVNVECMEGTVEMIYGGLSPEINKLAGATIIPYLCTTPEDALTVLRDDGYIYQTQVELCEEEGLQFLGFDFSGMCGLALKGNPPTDALSAGGGDSLQIRATSDVRLRDFLTELGYIPTSVEWSEVYSSVQTGVIDGFVGATALTAASQFSDVIDYYYEVGLFGSVNCIVVSDVLWEKLTDEQKAAFQEYSSGMLERSVEDYQEAAEAAYQQLKDAGVTVVIPTDEEQQELADLCRSNWGTLAEDFGEEFYQGLAEEFGLNG